ncbi:MAG TPA: hypothetical protein VLZ89_10510 [Anaerolineales bacterium]|nr:hypothetical protein [Anaerolineales bacterium]
MKTLTGSEIRQIWIDFFVEHGDTAGLSLSPVCRNVCKVPTTRRLTTAS